MDEPMTDFQFKALLKMVLEILKSSKSIEDAIAKSRPSWMRANKKSTNR